MSAAGASALYSAARQLGLGSDEALAALEVGARLGALGITAEEIEDARTRIINPTGWDTNRSLRSEHTARAALRDLQKRIGEGNAERGFHEEGSRLRRTAEFLESDEDAAALRNYYTARLALITTEVAEAIEELRNGRQVDETYYSGGYSIEDDAGEPIIESSEKVDHAGKDRKPEGVPSELADVVIRSFDLAHEAGIDLAAMIEEKLAYNATRARKHGREF